MKLKNQIIEAYLDYVNNYVSTEKFAAAYDLEVSDAKELIALGRRLRESHVPKQFTVVAVSSNTNAFGYKSVVCLAEDGEGFEGLVQAYGTDKVPVRGDVVLKTDPRWFAGVRALAPTLPKNAKKVLASVREDLVHQQASDAAFGPHGQG